jgi:L-asparaginase
MKITFISTGGTIDKVYFDAKGGYAVGESQVPEILRESCVTIEYDTMTLMKKDSLDFTDEDRGVIRQAILDSDGSRFVITHGTDTMVETARHLSGIPDKVIVLTGSLSPARFKHSDAIFNVGAAVAAVQCLPAGTYIAMNGRIFTPDRVQKNVEKNCFELITEE